MVIPYVGKEKFQRPIIKDPLGKNDENSFRVIDMDELETQWLIIFAVKNTTFKLIGRMRNQ